MFFDLQFLVLIQIWGTKLSNSCQNVFDLLVREEKTLQVNVLSPSMPLLKEPVSWLLYVSIVVVVVLLGNPTGLSWPNNRDSEIFLQLLPESVQRRSWSNRWWKRVPKKSASEEWRNSASVLLVLWRQHLQALWREAAKTCISTWMTCALNLVTCYLKCYLWLALCYSVL